MAFPETDDEIMQRTLKISSCYNFFSNENYTSPFLHVEFSLHGNRHVIYMMHLRSHIFITLALHCHSKFGVFLLFFFFHLFTSQTKHTNNTINNYNSSGN